MLIPLNAIFSLEVVLCEKKLTIFVPIERTLAKTITIKTITKTITNTITKTITNRL